VFGSFLLRSISMAYGIEDGEEKEYRVQCYETTVSGARHCVECFFLFSLAMVDVEGLK
jgi:hypothetical protein